MVTQRLVLELQSRVLYCTSTDSRVCGESDAAGMTNDVDPVPVQVLLATPPEPSRARPETAQTKTHAPAHSPHIYSAPRLNETRCRAHCRSVLGRDTVIDAMYRSTSSKYRTMTKRCVCSACAADGPHGRATTHSHIAYRPESAVQQTPPDASTHSHTAPLSASMSMRPRGAHMRKHRDRDRRPLTALVVWVDAAMSAALSPLAACPAPIPSEAQK